MLMTFTNQIRFVCLIGRVASKICFTDQKHYPVVIISTVVAHMSFRGEISGGVVLNSRQKSTFFPGFRPLVLRLLPLTLNRLRN